MVWSPRRDLDPRSFAYQANALTRLSYRGTTANYGCRALFFNFAPQYVGSGNKQIILNPFKDKSSIDVLLKGDE